MNDAIQRRLLLTKPHVQEGDTYIRITLVMHEGRWVIGTTSNQPPEVLWLFGLLSHWKLQAADQWIHLQNAKLAKEKAVSIIDRVMSK